MKMVCLLSNSCCVELLCMALPYDVSPHIYCISSFIYYCFNLWVECQLIAMVKYQQCTLCSYHVFSIAAYSISHLFSCVFPSNMPFLIVITKYPFPFPCTDAQILQFNLSFFHLISFSLYKQA